MFDDFDTQVQSDELIPDGEFYDIVCKEYDVDCDDGTSGDKVYEWIYTHPNFVGTI